VKSQHRSALFALAAAGTLWGLNVPLTKLALGWLGPGWLTVARFLVAAPVLGLIGRRGLREALTPAILVSGTIGFGAVILLQNAGIERTSVSHAAMIVGAIPVLVALIAAGLGEAATRPLTWAGYGVALMGIAFVAGAGGGGASPRGDVLVLGSAVLSGSRTGRRRSSRRSRWPRLRWPGRLCRSGSSRSARPVCPPSWPGPS
jgi:drug/metabolite transporter (DMT)-like permease